MRYAVALGCLVATLAVGSAVPTPPASAAGLIVHEWGTFTSIAGDDGRAVEWLPLAGPSDLPRFVHRLQINPKPSLPGTVRMETPVIYFYAPQDTTVDVRVRFRQGVITEWFPQASVRPSLVANRPLARRGVEGAIEWTDVNVAPRAAPHFPTADRPSHYYAARDTDASPVERASERDRFLFYRGVGSFPPPLAATVLADGSIEVSSEDAALGPLVLFENRGGRVRYELRHVDGRRTTFASALPAGDLDPLSADLHSALLANGLYPREATAMLATWKDSWFEEGTRLFYVVPRQTIDAILPLDIEPAPAEVARVFVGRVELITSATLDDVRRARAANDEAALGKYGRFLHHIVTRLK